MKKRAFKPCEILSYKNHTVVVFPDAQPAVEQLRGDDFIYQQDTATSHNASVSSFWHSVRKIS